MRADLRALVLKSPNRERLPLLEQTTDSSSVLTWLSLEEGRFFLRREREAWDLPFACIEKTFERYAAPLQQAGDFRGHLLTEDGVALAHMLYVPRFDVEPKDYLVLSLPGEEPLVELCAVLGPPLVHLARALRRS